MSGICAVRLANPAHVGETLGSIAAGLSLVPSERVLRQGMSCAGVGASVRFQNQQLATNRRVLLACDAELCNEPELRSFCGSREPGPAALMVALYDRLGRSFVEKLNGSFSFVLWDDIERTLIAAIDRFGISRLVYAQSGDSVMVASRIDALLRSGHISADVNPRAIANVMNFGVSLAPETIFRQIQRLAPGTMLIVSDSGMDVQPYWDMRYGVESGANPKKLAERLEAIVEQAVTAQCDTSAFSETGAYLSGGTDSSTVVGMMARLDRGPVKAFSIGFEEQQFNELGYAEIAARKFRADHRTYLVNANDCFEALPRMVRFFDEPFANSSAIPTYFCARLAAQNGVKTLLAGDGGDELFGGNERYLTDKIFNVYQTVPAVLRRGIIEPVLNRLPFENGVVGKARRYVRRSNIPAVERFFSYNLLCAHPAEEIFDRDFLADLAAYPILDVPSRYYREAPARDHLDRLLYIDVKITLGDSDLPKVTQMSELAGIQTRFPFLDRSVAEFSGSVPANLKVKGFDKRYLFKQAFRNLLPIEVIRKKKHGFGIPVANWLKTDRRLREFTRDTLFSARALGRGYFRRDFLDELMRLHDADESSYYGDNVWSFLVLEMWHRQFVDQPMEAAV